MSIQFPISRSFFLVLWARRYGTAVAIILGVLAAVCFGAGDFYGGLSAKRTAVVNVVAFSHLVGLVGVLTVSLLFAENFRVEALGIGAAAGLFGAVGVVLLYRGLSTGPMAVVAPITAITSALVPSLWGVLDGESLSAVAWVGVAIAVVAIGLVSLPKDVDTDGITLRVVAESLLAGVGFGVFFILFDIAPDDVGAWPVVGARMVTVLPLVPFVLMTRRPDLPAVKATAMTIFATGALDTGANVLFLIATTLGELTIVSVLSSLYPVTTVVLARSLLNERMSSFQVAGLALAIAATTLIALG